MNAFSLPRQVDILELARILAKYDVAQPSSKSPDQGRSGLGCTIRPPRLGRFFVTLCFPFLFCGFLSQSRSRPDLFNTASLSLPLSLAFFFSIQSSPRKLLFFSPTKKPVQSNLGFLPMTRPLSKRQPLFSRFEFYAN